MKDKLKEKINEIVNTAKNEGRELTDDEQLMIDALTFQLKSLPNETEDTEVTETEEVEDEKKDETTDTEDNDSNKEDEDVKEVVETETPATEEDTKQEDEDAEVSENEEVEDKEKDKTNNDKRNFNIKMNKEFKLIRAINQMANNKPLDEVTAAVSAAGKEEMRNAGLTAEGALVIPSETRAISVTDSVGATVGVDVNDILAPLRDNLVLAKAGARFMTGLKNDLKIPVMTGSEAQWESEREQNTGDSTASFSSVTLKPKRISVVLPVSKQFLIQSSDSAEAILKENIMNAIGEKLQKTILSSTITDPKAPKGIFAATPEAGKTYAALCTLESKVDDKNLGENRVYVASNKAKAAFRQMTKSANGPMVYDKGEIDGTPCLSTSSVVDNGFLYGDFSQLYIGQFGGTEIIVDGYTRAAYGEVLLTVNAYFDAALAREGAVLSGTVTK